MSRQPASQGGRAETTEFRQELLGRLGLRPDASDQDVESAHNGLVEFLELAPHGLQSWATARTNDVDEAYALLSGPEQDLIPPASQSVAAAQDGPDETSRLRADAPAASAAPEVPTAPGARKPRRTQIVWAVTPLLVVAVVVGVYFMGKGSDVPGISGATTSGATATAAPGPTAVPVDPAKVAALTTKVTANPKDIASLQSLGDLYFAAADYKNASVWEQKILVVDPKNKIALISLGAAQFNIGNKDEAKKQWLVAAKLYPREAEVHYDLGFLYMSQTPPDTANMQAEWKKVVDIDPNSKLAKTVSAHIKAPTATPSAK
jgi:tetratricopeptide (TPR) repeat protein